MFTKLKIKRRFNQYCKNLRDRFNPIIALSISSIGYVDPKMNTNRPALYNSSFITSIDAVAFLSFLSYLKITQPPVSKERQRSFMDRYLEYLGKLMAFVFSVPPSQTKVYLLNRLTYLEEVFMSSCSTETLVNEFSNLLHRDAIYKKYKPIEGGTQLSFNALEHIEYYTEAVNLLLFWESSISPSIPDVVKHLMNLDQREIKRKSTEKIVRRTGESKDQSQEVSSSRKHEPVYLMEAANGMLVNVPESRLEAWEAEQDKLRKGENLELTKAERESINRILDAIYGPKDSGTE